jgi:hypothetical protein
MAAFISQVGSGDGNSALNVGAPSGATNAGDVNISGNYLVNGTPASSSPGGVSGDYQINNGSGGFAASSLNQPNDGAANLTPSNPANFGQLAISNNATDAFATMGVAPDGSYAIMSLDDTAGNTIVAQTAIGLHNSTGIFDNGVRQFLGVFTVGALPGGSNAGDTAAVSDATAPVLGDAPIGSGAKFCRVMWTGSIWVCG